MILGTVTANLQAVVHLHVRGQEQEAEVEAVIDTGFNRFLTMPVAVVRALNLLPLGVGQVALANGESAEVRIYQAGGFWNGVERIVDVLETEGDCLIGMALLQGHELRIEVRDGGAVTIETSIG